MLVASILVFNSVYKGDSIGALRHRNQWGNVEKIRTGRRECTEKEGAVERRRKGQKKLLAEK